MRRSRAWFGALRTAASDRRGNIATMTAFLLVPLTILLAGVLNFGFAWVVKNYLQVTADAAALAGASQLGDDDAVVAEANEFAEENMPSDTNGDVLADEDIEIGNWNKNTRVFTPGAAPENAVRATTRRTSETGNPVPTFLGAFIGRDDWDLAAVAIAARADNFLGCLLALDPTGSSAFQMGGNATLALTNCSAMSNSSHNQAFSITGSAVSSMACAMSVGGINIQKVTGLTLTQCEATMPNLPSPAPDPFDEIPEPTVPNSCNTSLPNGQGAQTIQPGCYKGGSLKGTKTFASGVYVFTGNVQISAQANITGSNVTFFFTNNATIDMNANGTVNLSAPTSGPYNGLLFWGNDSNTNNTNLFNGTGASHLTGAIYFPKQTVDYRGNFTGVNGCLRIVAFRIDFRGNTNMSVNCPALPPIPLQAKLALVD